MYLQEVSVYRPSPSFPLEKCNAAFLLLPLCPIILCVMVFWSSFGAPFCFCKSSFFPFPVLGTKDSQCLQWGSCLPFLFSGCYEGGLEVVSCSPPSLCRALFHQTKQQLPRSRIPVHGLLSWDISGACLVVWYTGEELAWEKKHTFLKQVSEMNWLSI